MQALDRTQPGLPLKKGRAATITHDYKRNGTTTLFAAFSVLDGQVIAQCQPRHRHIEWLKFLKQIDNETPQDKTLHLIYDNYAAHKHPKMQAWLAKHRRFIMHFTPTSASWLNMVERFFRDISEKRLRRASQHQPQTIYLDQERSRHTAEGDSCQQSLKFQTECNTALDASLAAADLVICQTGCISHNAYWRVKDFCKRTGKRCVFVENPSTSSLARGLEQISVKSH